MANYSLTNKAIEDLSTIWNYTADTWSEDQANKSYLMLLDYCQQLAIGKIHGKSYEKITYSLQGFKAGKHIIFYRRTQEQQIEVIRFLQVKMDLKDKFMI